MKRASIRTTRTPLSSGRAELSRMERGARAVAVRKRPPRVVFVVACSQRKRILPPTELRLSSIQASPDERLVEWARRIRDVEAPKERAGDLYAGDHWRSACEAYRLAKRYSSRA